MNATTLQDPAILERLEGFVVIRADADARPDLVDRYRRYGWPATVFLTPEGEQILGVRGFRDAARFGEILDQVAAAHADGRTLEEERGGAMEDDLEALRVALLGQLDRQYDEEQAGWGRQQRYPFAEPVEHAFFRAAIRGEDVWRERALASLEQYARLIDPVFGGMYQYSVGGVWDRPHFEKIAAVQAGALRAFAEAYEATGDAVWLERAEAVRGYLREQLRAESGVFYASQDADLGGHGQPGPHVTGDAYYALDDAGRRALGFPRVDRHVYAANNGMLADALAKLALASRQRAPLMEASRAIEQILQTHLREGGLLAHDAESDDPLFYLADQAWMLRAMITLHQASGQPRWLERARSLADAMLERLGAEGGGLNAHTPDPRSAGFFAERVPIEDSAVAARALSMLARLAEEPRYAEAAIAALRASARVEELRSMGRMVGETLLALENVNAGWVVLSVVGPDTPETNALYEAARDLHHPMALVELGRPGASRYPYPGEPAVFLCSGEACSMPVTEAAQLGPAARAFLESAR